MNETFDEHYCRICGLDLGEAIWGELFAENCPCCGAEFGYHDFNLHMIRKKRAEWLLNPNKWDVPKEKPANWDHKEQMKNIPKQYL